MSRLLFIKLFLKNITIALNHSCAGMLTEKRYLFLCHEGVKHAGDERHIEQSHTSCCVCDWSVRWHDGKFHSYKVKHIDSLLS